MPKAGTRGHMFFSSLEKDRLALSYTKKTYLCWPYIIGIPGVKFHRNSLTCEFCFRNSWRIPTNVRSSSSSNWALKVPLGPYYHRVGRILTPWMPWILNKTCSACSVDGWKKSRFPTTLWMVLKLIKPCKSCRDLPVLNWCRISDPSTVAPHPSES